MRLWDARVASYWISDMGYRREAMDMKTAWLKDHAVFYVARLSRASRLSRLSSASRLFYECTVGVVSFAVADDEELTIDEAFADIGIINSNILNCCIICVEMQLHRQIV